MRARMIGVFLVLALGLALPPAASAQLNQTGTLVGTVTDNQGEALPGATVTIKSPALILPQMDALTGPRGQYRFLALPPGLYEVTFQLSGLATFIRKDIRINVGQTTTIDAVLEQKTISENVVVVGKTPTIDLQSNAKSTNLDQIFLTTIPSARNLDALFNMAPGVVAEQNNNTGAMSSANGSGVRDNAFNMDGVNMTDPMVGVQLYEFGLEIIDEVAITTGGLPAQFGDATGATINIVTRSGGNKVRGTLSTYYNSEFLQSNNTDGTPLAGMKSGYKYMVEPGFTLGGPLIKDKLWFFTSLSFNARASNVPGFPYDKADQVSAKETRPMPFVKLTFQPNQSDRFTVSYNFSDIRKDNNGASQYMTEDTTVKWTAPTHIFNLQWTKMFSSSFYSDFKVGYVASQTNLKPKNDLASIYEMTTNRGSGGNYLTDLYTQKRLQINANGTYFVDGLVGSHEFKAGVEAQQTGNTRSESFNTDPRNGMCFIYTYLGTPLYGMVAEPFDAEWSATSLHGYLQDSWKPFKRLSLNLGLRLSYQAGRIPAQNESEGPQTFMGLDYNRSVPEAINAFSRVALAPRLGMIFDVTGDGKTLLKASYSRYVQANLTQYFMSANPNGLFYYGQALFPDWTVIPNAYLVASLPNPARVGYNGSGLKAPYTDEWTIALERELLPDWSVAARYTRKADRNLIEDVDANQLDIDRLMNDGELVWTNWVEVPYTDPYDGDTKTIWSQKSIVAKNLYIVNPPGATRDFDGFELTLAKRYSRGWSLMASYVWQSARGLIGTEYNSGWGGANLYNSPNAHINASGHFPLERRNQIKLQAQVTGPWGINVSGFFRYYSGQRYTRTISSADLLIPLAQGVTIVNAEPLGSGTLPDQAILDLRLEKSFRLGDRSFALFADVFNLFNGNKAVAVWTQSSSLALAYGQMTMIQDPRVVRLGFRFNF